MMKKCLEVLVCLFTCLLILACVEPASAHKVNVFAWIEGNTVQTESFFSDGKKAVNAKIEVYGPDETLLVQGTTDGAGRYVFEAPLVADLKIVLNESMGHRAEYHLGANEFGSEKANTHGSDAQAHVNPDRIGNVSDVHDNVHMDENEHHARPNEEIKAIMAQVLEEKLSPIRAKLASLETGGPKLSEIIGGLGYIIGLMGVALYFKSRKNNGCL